MRSRPRTPRGERTPPPRTPLERTRYRGARAAETAGGDGAGIIRREPFKGDMSWSLPFRELLKRTRAPYRKGQ